MHTERRMEITREQRDRFHEEGLLIIPDYLEGTALETVRAVCDASVNAIERDMRERGVTEDRINVLGKKYFVLSARKNYPELMPVIFSERAASVCRATIGNTAYLHNEQFVVKKSDSDTAFAWHQDSGYSVYSGGAARHEPYLTFWIALDDMSESNGTISVLPFNRAPSRGLMEHTWDATANAMVGYTGDDPGDPVNVPAGTLVAFSSFLLHRSGANLSERPRRSYFVAYTPTLFTHGDSTRGIYSSGDPLLVDGIFHESAA